ncbi:MAG: flavin reductase family protein [Armatimonadota bacterium]|nr:flavin reductase family protein [Armatimonadota bacterium]
MTTTGSDPRAYRRVMGLFATGVSVMAVNTDDGVLGMTANSVASVSLDPLLVLVCVDRRARIAAHLQIGRPFSLSFLRDDQEVLSRYFAGGWREFPTPEHRFAAWDGAPRLIGALAAVRCVIDRLHDGGDHWIVVGRVDGLFSDDGHHNPLIFFAGRYRRLAPLAPDAPPEHWGPDGVSIYYEEWSAPPHTAATKAGDAPE